MHPDSAQKDGGLRYLRGDPKAIFFTDFDGTITLQDCNDHLVDNYGFGAEKRRMLELEVLKGNMTYRDALRTMLDSVRMPFDTCLRIIQDNIQLDPHFLAFYYWAKEQEVPIVILSSGMTTVIEALLESLFGCKPDNIFVVANGVEPRCSQDINTDGGWRIKYRDDSSFGHDKGLEIQPYAALRDQHRPLLLYAGDGVSDLSAASETHILFAKEGLDLMNYCEQNKTPYIPFDNWATILDVTREIHEGISKFGFPDALPDGWMMN